MTERFSRTELILGKENMEKLAASRIAVFGAGGVGGYVIEALARSGIGELDIIDNDTICPSNINRQIYADEKTIGRYKTDVARERILNINPKAIVHTYNIFYIPDTSAQFDISQYDYIVDAIDTVTGKIELIVRSNECNVPIISSMGTGNKVNPAMLEVSDIYSTEICPLAKVMRKELKKRGIQSLKVVYSKEKPIKPISPVRTEDSVKRSIPGSTSFVPPVAGFIIAGEVIKDITSFKNE